MASATEAYRSESDRLAAFLEECCVTEMWARVGKSELYAAYHTWSQNSGEYPVSKRRLGQQLMERGFDEERTKRQRNWIGLGLLNGGASDASG